MHVALFYCCFSTFPKTNSLRSIWSNPQAVDLVENHNFKIIKKRKENKGKVFKFVGFKTTWASKIIEKQLDQAKKCTSDVSRCLRWWDDIISAARAELLKKHCFYNKKCLGRIAGKSLPPRVTQLAGKCRPMKPKAEILHRHKGRIYPRGAVTSKTV